MNDHTTVTPEDEARDAEYHAGLLVAGRSALKKAAHEQYNSAEAQALRLQAEVGQLDAKAKAAIEFLSDGEDPGVAQDLESQVLKKAFLAKRRSEDGATAAPEPRADGLDVVAEQIDNAKPVDNPKLTDPNANEKSAASAKVDVAPPGRKKAV